MSESSESKSGSGVYLLGVLLLAAAIGGIVYVMRKDPPKTEPTTHAEPKPPEPVNNAPPPPAPPKLEDLPDAGDDAGDAGKADVKVVSTGGGGGMCTKCTEGQSSSTLNSKVQGLAGSAQGCYNRALRTSAASGRRHPRVDEDGDPD